jgi:excisionase family DNA binding protein
MSAHGEQHTLAAALVELLAASPLALARLQELVAREMPVTSSFARPAYTVASLAATLEVSPRVIRGAIARGELDAAKRGGRWIISAAAVGRWAESDREPAAVRRPRRRPNGRASLAAVMALLDTGANRGETRL